MKKLNVLLEKTVKSYLNYQKIKKAYLSATQKLTVWPS